MESTTFGAADMSSLPWPQISRAIGWTYVFLWTVSFYPQPLSNYRRKSTTGVSIDYYTANLYGQFCFIINAAVLLYSPVVRAQYAQRHPSAPHPSTRLNDLAFAVHACLAISLVLSQFVPRIWGFEVSQRSRRPSWTMLLVCLGLTLTAGLACARIIVTPRSGLDASDWCWLDLVNLFGQIKVLITIVKYLPQAWKNYERKSTSGFNINGVLLDIAGGLLSLIQLVIDCTLDGDWRQITANPLKFGLANISMLFSAVYMWQHYVLYRDADAKLDMAIVEAGAEDDTEESPLLRRQAQV